MMFSKTYLRTSHCIIIIAFALSLTLTFGNGYEESGNDIGRRQMDADDNEIQNEKDDDERNIGGEFAVEKKVGDSPMKEQEAVEREINEVPNDESLEKHSGDKIEDSRSQKHKEQTVASLQEVVDRMKNKLKEFEVKTILQEISEEYKDFSSDSTSEENEIKSELAENLRKRKDDETYQMELGPGVEKVEPRTGDDSSVSHDDERSIGKESMDTDDDDESELSNEIKELLPADNQDSSHKNEENDISSSPMISSHDQTSDKSDPILDDLGRLMDNIFDENNEKILSSKSKSSEESYDALTASKSKEKLSTSPDKYQDFEKEFEDMINSLEDIERTDDTDTHVNKEEKDKSETQLKSTNIGDKADDLNSKSDNENDNIDLYSSSDTSEHDKSLPDKDDKVELKELSDYSSEKHVRKVKRSSRESTEDPANLAVENSTTSAVGISTVTTTVDFVLTTEETTTSNMVTSKQTTVQLPTGTASTVFVGTTTGTTTTSSTTTAAASPNTTQTSSTTTSSPSSSTTSSTTTSLSDDGSDEDDSTTPPPLTRSATAIPNSTLVSSTETTSTTTQTTTTSEDTTTEQSDDATSADLTTSVTTQNDTSTSDPVTTSDSTVITSMSTTMSLTTVATTSATTDATTRRLTTPPDPCASSPCKNLASCIITGGGFECLCTDPLTTGTFCELRMDPCDVDPCPAGAGCVNLTTERYCVCPGDKKGALCNEADERVQCNSDMQLSRSLLDTETIVCLPLNSTTPNDFCYDADDALVYDIQQSWDVFHLSTNATTSCLVVDKQNVTAGQYNVTLTAYEADDVVYRPFRSDDIRFFVIFNQPPVISGVNSLMLNVRDIPPGFQALIFSVEDQYGGSSTLFAIKDVMPPEYQSYFSISRSAGELYIVQIPEVNGPSLNINLTIEVVDNGLPPLATVMHVTFDFVNSSLSCITPLVVFVDLPYDATDVVTTINCTGSNINDLNYTTKSDSDLSFSVSDDGDVYIIRQGSGLDPGSYRAQIVVSSNPVTSSTVSFQVIADNFTPQCLPLVQSLKISENETVGRCFDVFSCTGPAGYSQACGTLSFGEKVDNITQVMCSINSSSLTVAICLTQSLLGKDLVGTYQLKGSVYNSIKAANITLNVTVTNVDEPPRFTISSHTASVSEDVPKNYTILQLTVVDPDPNDKLTFSIKEPGLPFKLSDKGLLSTDGQLNATETSLYTFRVVVTDLAGLSDEATVILTVIDVNEPPICAPPILIFTMLATDSVGTLVGRISCYDTDKDLINKEIVYRIDTPVSQEILDLFLVSDRGDITLLKDFPVNQVSYDFRVKVKDTAGAATYVNISVLVNRDIPPECQHSQVNVTLSEKIRLGECTTVPSSCIDPLSGVLWYRSVGLNGTSYFDIPVNTSGALQLCTMTSLDGLYGNLVLDILVNNTYAVSQLLVIVTVLDENDPPQFTKPSYNFSVPEGIRPPAFVGIVSATDPDSGILADLAYSINSTDFAVDRLTGVITSTQTMNASMISAYNFVAQVSDGGNLETTANVVVRVEDWNDPPNCSVSIIRIDISLITPVGTVVGNLFCWDWDLDKRNSTIKYLIQNDPTGIFTIEADGNITVKNPIPRVLQDLAFSIRVTDEWMETSGNMAGQFIVSALVNVDRNIPPECSEYQLTGTFLETQPVGDCLGKEIICKDPTHGNITMGTMSGDASQYVEVKRRPTVPSELPMSLCIKSNIKNKTRNYEVKLQVLTDLGATVVTWLFDIVDVNEPPVFFNTPRAVNVSEKSPTGKLFEVLVDDPDSDPLYRTISLTDEVLDTSPGESVSISLIRTEFYVTGPLNATERDKYVFELNATDGGGLFSLSNITFLIMDVNEVPVCNPVSYTFKTTVLSAIGRVLGQIFCSDIDIVPVYRNLVYQSQSPYFSVSSDGKFSVASLLPRMQTFHSFIVVVTDLSLSPLSARVNVAVEVNNTIPAKCNPRTDYPSVWVIGHCVKIEMNCVDPTKSGTDHLKYVVNGNYTVGFTLDKNDTGNFTFCYTRRDSNNFQIIIEVDNELATLTRVFDILVVYDQSTPLFLNTPYTISMAENAVVGTIVIQVEASAQGSQGNILYSLVSGSVTNWADIFQIESVTGKILTKISLRDYSTDTISLTVKALNDFSQLSATSQVTINIIDINEPPRCLFYRGGKDLRVDLRVFDPVGMILSNFTCADYDVLPQNQELSYILSSTNAEWINYFELVDIEKGVKDLRVKNPLSVFTHEYKMYIVVNDTGTPSLGDLLTLMITVNLLPPPITVTAFAVNSSTIEVQFRYDRRDFYNVTRDFLLTATSLSENNTFTIPSNGTITKSLLINMRPDTTYSVVLKAATDYGEVSSTPISVTTPAIPVISEFIVSLKMTGISFSDRYYDSGSFAYVTLSEEVTRAMRFILDRTLGFVSFSVISFRPGSVIVDSLVSVNEQIGNVNDTIDAIQRAVTTGWIGNISVDPSYFIIGMGDGYIRVNRMVSNTTAFYDGSYVNFTCYTDIVGDVGNLKYEWYVNNSLIRPTSISRWQTANISTAATPKVYTLTVSPLTARDTGSIMCRVYDNQGLYSTSTVRISVVARPTIVVEPRSKTVTAGESVNVSCTVTTPRSYAPTFMWYQDGKRVTAGDVIFSVDMFHQVLRLRDVQQTTRVTCGASNVAGSSANITAEIGAIQRASQYCRINQDSRGTVWKDTVEGIVAVEDCPDQYTGTATRACLTGGTWAAPNYDNCVRETLTELYQESQDLKEGVERDSSEVILQTLAEETGDTDDSFTGGDLEVSSLILNDFVTVAEERSDSLSNSTLSYFLQSTSNLLDARNKEEWYNMVLKNMDGVSKLMKAATDYTKIATTTASLNMMETINKENLVALVSTLAPQDVVFPVQNQALPDWYKGKSTVNIDKATLESIGGSQPVGLSCIYYRNIGYLLHPIQVTDSGVDDFNNSLIVNSDVLDISINQNYNGVLNPPMRLNFKNRNTNSSNPKCVFWDFHVPGTPNGAWSSTGCTVVSFTETETVCECTHLTNFAVLMSPGITPDKDILPLNIISAVGCGVSFLFLIITVVVYGAYWRYVKSDRATILMNLCVALIISYAVFLGGINRTEIKEVCTTVAAVLHFILLVVFFLMLAEGIEMAISVLYVFSTRSRVSWLMPLSWILPAVIVGISLGITKTEGYGNDQFCWLSIDDGLLYAFVGPALAVVLTNTVLLFLVLRAMFSSHMMMTKSAKEQVKSGVRSMSVILPVMGVTWVFGIFSVNEDLVLFQYLFAIFNSFQGLFIFIFHCLLNRQIKDAINHSRRRKRSLAEIHSTRSTSQSTPKSQISSSKDNIERIQNDIDKDKKANPFLEADRQAVQHIVDSKLKGEDNNAFDGVEKEKNVTKGNIIGLEDVKISNILRQSEVSGADSQRPKSVSSSAYESISHESSHSGDSRQRRPGYNSREYDNRLDPSLQQQVPETDQYHGSLEKQSVGQRLSNSSSQTRTSTTTLSTSASGSNYTYIDPPSRSQQYGRFSRSEEDLERRVYDDRSRIDHVYSTNERPSGRRTKDKLKRANSYGSSYPQYRWFQSRDYVEAQLRGQQYQSRLQKKTYDPEPAQRKGMPHWGKAKHAAAAKKQQLQKEDRHQRKSYDRVRHPQHQPQGYVDYHLGPPQQALHHSLEDVSMQYMGYQPYGGIRNHGKHGKHGKRPANNRPPEGWDYQVAWHEPQTDYWH